MKKNNKDKDISTTSKRSRVNSAKIRKKKKIKKIITTIFADFLLFAVGLLVFALFHHALPKVSEVEPILLATPSPEPAPTVNPTTTPTATTPTETQAASPAETPAASPTETPEPIDWGTWGEKFKDKFTDGEVIVTDSSYQSKSINVTIERIKSNGITYYVSDIYIRDLENFRTAFAKDTYGRRINDSTINIAKKNKAITAVSGDYYGVRQDGIVIRNGQLYRDNIFEDILIMNNDGSMETFSPKEFDINAILKNGAYQGWSFGPMLLKDGEVMSKFNSKVNPENPRTAIGYYEPGHYCFIVVDGRQPGYSNGITLHGLSQLFYDLGCKAAYNLDGGQTSVITFMRRVKNKPYKGGRDVSDIVYIAEIEEEQ